MKHNVLAACCICMGTVTCMADEVGDVYKLKDNMDLRIISIIDDYHFDGEVFASGRTTVKGDVTIPTQLVRGVGEESKFYEVIKIADSGFANCTELTYLQLPTYLEIIGNEALSGCTAMTNIRLLCNVESIGNGAFRDCESLNSVVLPLSLATMSDNIFDGCNSLSTIYLCPSNSASINAAAINQLSSLTHIYTTDQGLEWCRNNITSDVLISNFTDIVCPEWIYDESAGNYIIKLNILDNTIDGLKIYNTDGSVVIPNISENENEYIYAIDKATTDIRIRYHIANNYPEYIQALPSHPLSISSITNDGTVTSGIYDMNGRLISTDNKIEATLPTGVYIKDGKKVMINH